MKSNLKGQVMNQKVSEIPQIVMLPGSVLERFQETQDKILERLKNIQTSDPQNEYLTALEFMERTKMSRASFDEKRAKNEFKVIVKGRKLFVPGTEVKRYFEG